MALWIPLCPAFSKCSHPLALSPLLQHRASDFEGQVTKICTAKYQHFQLHTQDTCNRLPWLFAAPPRQSLTRWWSISFLPPDPCLTNTHRRAKSCHKSPQIPTKPPPHPSLRSSPPPPGFYPHPCCPFFYLHPTVLLGWFQLNSVQDTGREGGNDGIFVRNI